MQEVELTVVPATSGSATSSARSAEVCEDTSSPSRLPEYSKGEPWCWRFNRPGYSHCPSCDRR